MLEPSRVLGFRREPYHEEKNKPCPLQPKRITHIPGTSSIRFLTFSSLQRSLLLSRNYCCQVQVPTSRLSNFKESQQVPFANEDVLQKLSRHLHHEACSSFQTHNGGAGCRRYRWLRIGCWCDICSFTVYCSGRQRSPAVPSRFIGEEVVRLEGDLFFHYR